jgi:hypothetical protein
MMYALPMSNLRQELIELRAHIDALIAFLPGQKQEKRTWSPERRAKFLESKKKAPASKKKPG